MQSDNKRVDLPCRPPTAGDAGTARGRGSATKGPAKNKKKKPLFEPLQYFPLYPTIDAMSADIILKLYSALRSAGHFLVLINRVKDPSGRGQSERKQEYDVMWPDLGGKMNRSGFQTATAVGYAVLAAVAAAMCFPEDSKDDKHLWMHPLDNKMESIVRKSLDAVGTSLWKRLANKASNHGGHLLPSTVELPITQLQALLEVHPECPFAKELHKRIHALLHTRADKVLHAVETGEHVVAASCGVQTIDHERVCDFLMHAQRPMSHVRCQD